MMIIIKDYAKSLKLMMIIVDHNTIKINESLNIITEETYIYGLWLRRCQQVSMNIYN